MQDIIKIFKALSDETRLRILSLLMVRECCVCEVMQVLGISQTRASRNLKVLHDAGLLAQRKEGLWVVYSVDGKTMSGTNGGLLRAMAEALEGNDIVRRDRERLERAERVGPAAVSQTLVPAGSNRAEKK